MCRVLGITAGIILVIIGLLVQCASGLVRWVGHLPDDIHYESENTRIYIPITSKVILGFIISLLLYLLWR